MYIFQSLRKRALTKKRKLVSIRKMCHTVGVAQRCNVTHPTHSGGRVKILLTYLSDSNDTREYSTTIIPSGIISLAAYLEKSGHETSVANYSRLGYKKALQKIIEMNPEIAGFSLLTHNRNDTIKLIRELKSKMPGIITVAGGPHASVLSAEMIKKIPEIDYVIEGEGEAGFDHLITRLKGIIKPSKIIKSKPRTETDSLPFSIEFSGAMTGVNPNEQYKFINPVRGGEDTDPFSCAGKIWGVKRASRSAASIVSEIELIHRKQGVIFFNLTDEVFTSSADDIRRFCSEIIERKFYPMWSCHMRPGVIDEATAVMMKHAGCERVYLTAVSGSEKILAEVSPGVSTEMIGNDCGVIRSAGLYLSLILRAGMYDEKHSDITKSIALIRRTLPGDGLVFPAVYYPGSLIYEKAVESQRLHPSAMFDKKDKGLYLRNDPEVKSWIEQLRSEFKMIRQKSWYREKDFKQQRKLTGDCWVTNLLEGDYCLDEENERCAEQMYMRIVSQYPRNPWGHLRLGKLSFGTARFDAAEVHYGKVTEIIPGFYGGWLKLAESLIAQGRRREGKEAANRAYQLNTYDVRVAHLVKDV